jgi:Glycosyl hydrolases family 2, sugar binding domain/Glycosyl hydrolases family 2/Glycosyl hydrolases family 2, TIM barrel domain
LDLRWWMVNAASAAAMGIISGLGAAGASENGAAGEWRPAQVPLMTKYAADVRPESVRPEYPRPLLVRDTWQSLNGLWQFAFDDTGTGKAEGWTSGKEFPQTILVPFTFESALSGIGKGKEIHEHVWYRRTLSVPQTWRTNDQRVLLNFGACDWKTAVYVNGLLVGEHTGGYSPFSFDITDALKPDGPQELVVSVYDPADPAKGAYQPKGKQLGSEGIWYTRTTGIWQSVWMEPVHTGHVRSVRTEVNLAASTLTVLLNSDAASLDKASVKLLYKGSLVGTAEGAFTEDGFVAIPIHVKNPALWSPETPALYDLEISCSHGGTVLDSFKSYAAFREVGIQNGRLTLNGKPYFYRGVLDQGYWPDGILTPPTDAAIKNDVEMVKHLGFNMARKHVKIEDPRWYYWCDHLGVAVWQDMPSSHNLSTPEARSNFTMEWKNAMETTRGYPCVLHWIPFNENWGDPKEFQDEIVQLTRTIDPHRPITDASGWTQRGLTDVIDAHDYGNNLIAQGVEHPVKPKVVGEFGGIALPVPNHTWSQGWGYQSVKDADGLVQKICYQTTQLFEAANLSGYVYTQLTDVEQELNGLLTYDRQPKADPSKVAADFTGAARAHRPPQIADWLVLGPIPSGTVLASAENNEPNRAVMQATLDKPFLPGEATLAPKEGEEVTLEGMRYSWKHVHAASGIVDFIKLFGKQIDNAAVYAVTVVNSDSEQKNVTLSLGADDGAKVWLNGQMVSNVARIRGVTLDDDVVHGLTLHKGRNVLVVKVGQGTGGWGLTARFDGLAGQK